MNSRIGFPHNRIFAARWDISIHLTSMCRAHEREKGE
jgi:hypothetical protein